MNPVPATDARQKPVDDPPRDHRGPVRDPIGPAKEWLAIVAIVSVTLFTLRQFGQVWWCACGSPVPWSWQIHTSHNSQHAIDPYSFTHVLHGLIFYAALFPLRGTSWSRWRLLIAIGAESCWEVLENTPMIIERYRTATLSLNYYGDSVFNSLFDILSCGLGYWIASRVSWKISLALFVATEVVLTLTIRDCLTLNVVMLLYPIEAIKQWQM